MLPPHTQGKRGALAGQQPGKRKTAMTSRSPLKVLFLTSSYPRSEPDTAAVFLRYLAEALAARGIEVHVLSPADGKSTTKMEGAVTVHRFQYFPVRWQQLAYGSGILSNLQRSPWLRAQVPFYVAAMTLSLLRLLRAQHFDLLHAHWIVPQGLIGILANKLYAVPLVTTAHGADAFALRGRFSRFLKRLVIAHTTVCTVNTPATLRAIGSEASSRPARLMPMGVDVARFACGDRALLRQLIPNDRFLLLFVGRLVEKKGCHDLLRAMALLTPLFQKRATLWIVGDGDQKSALKKTAKDTGLDQQIRFWGVVPNDQLPNFYAAADLFIAPSIETPSGDTEGQGVVLLEAFAARTCVLATRVGGIDAVVHDQVTGILVPPAQPEKLAQWIENLMNNSVLRSTLANNAFTEVKERYDWHNLAGNFAQLYGEILNSQRQ